MLYTFIFSILGLSMVILREGKIIIRIVLIIRLGITMSEKNKKSENITDETELIDSKNQENLKVKESDNSESKDYEFVTETIKKKPFNKKRLLIKTAYSIFMGLLAGLVACLVFVYVEPMMYKKIHPETVDHVSIPKDEQIEENQPENETEDVKNEEQSSDASESDDKLKIDNISDENNDGSDNGEKADDTSNPDETNGQTGDTPANEVDSPSTNTEEGEAESAPEKHVEQIYITKDVTLDDFKTYYREMNAIANTTRKSLVTVKGVTENTDWFNNSYESGNISTGLIVADNGKEILVITDSTKLKTAKEIEVTFCNGKAYKGAIKKSDANTSLVVVAVSLEDLDNPTKNSIKYAELGNSTNYSIVGSPVLAVGSPLGIDDSIAFGRVTSNTRTLDQIDSNIRYLTTDIYGSTDGSGVIVDLDGKVIGIIFQGGLTTESKNLIHAYSISDIKSKIEKLSNGQDQAYLGIIGTDVTRQAKEELGVPEGTYVKQVVVDSPAMKAGIQNGDVIVKVGTTDIRSFDDYEDSIYRSQPGDIAVVTVKRLSKDGYVEFSYEIYLEALK